MGPFVLEDTYKQCQLPNGYKCEADADCLSGDCASLPNNRFQLRCQCNSGCKYVHGTVVDSKDVQGDELECVKFCSQKFAQGDVRHYTFFASPAPGQDNCQCR